MGVDIEHCDVSHTVFDGCTDDVELTADDINSINDAKKWNVISDKHAFVLTI